MLFNPKTVHSTIKDIQCFTGCPFQSVLALNMHESPWLESKLVDHINKVVLELVHLLIFMTGATSVLVLAASSDGVG
jgi:hypothetical protein